MTFPIMAKVVRPVSRPEAGKKFILKPELVMPRKACVTLPGVPSSGSANALSTINGHWQDDTCGLCGCRTRTGELELGNEPSRADNQLTSDIDD
jgi:hypothetical protein